MQQGRPPLEWGRPPLELHPALNLGLCLARPLVPELPLGQPLVLGPALEGSPNRTLGPDLLAPVWQEGRRLKPDREQQGDRHPRLVRRTLTLGWQADKARVVLTSPQNFWQTCSERSWRLGSLGQ